MTYYDEPYAEAGQGFITLMFCCVRCGGFTQDNPDTVPVVLVNHITLCSLRPDGSDVRRGDPDASNQPLCRPCAHALKRLGTGPVLELFPLARVDRIRIPQAPPTAKPTGNPR